MNRLPDGSIDWANTDLDVFTPKMVRELSQSEVIEFWRRRQIARRDRGDEYFDRLFDPKTDRTVCAIPGADA